MAQQVILLDTSILIEHFRKTDKNNSTLMTLARKSYIFYISAITDFEIYSGATKEQLKYWDEFLKRIEVLPFDGTIARIAAEINFDLKKKRKQIAIPDLFIAATAVAHRIPLSTLNKKHFQRVEQLKMIQ